MKRIVILLVLIMAVLLTIFGVWSFDLISEDAEVPSVDENVSDPSNPSDSADDSSQPSDGTDAGEGSGGRAPS